MTLNPMTDLLTGSSIQSLDRKPQHYLTLDLVPIEHTTTFVSMSRSMLRVLVAIIVSCLLIGLFISRTIISGAVVGQGTLVVESGAKKVQHQTGGIVKKLLIANDERVIAGQALVELDTSVTDAQLVSVSTQLVQQRARFARLMSERDGLDSIKFPADLNYDVIGKTELDAIIQNENRQFELRQIERSSQRSQLNERIKQTENEAAGDAAQFDAQVKESEFVKKDLDIADGMFKKGLLRYSQFSLAGREFYKLLATQSALQSRIASNRARIAELRLMIIQVDQSLRSEITDQIAEAQAAVAALREKQAAALDTASRSIIRAPIDGVVHELAIHTVGGVVQQAETLMLVVPGDDKLIGEVKVKPSDIDQIYNGQKTEVHFSAFDRGTTPSLNGNVIGMSPDLIEDKRSGAGFYTIKVGISKEELARLPQSLHLVAGMPLEAFVRTDDRTILSYLVKPLMDQLNRSFR